MLYSTEYGFMLMIIVICNAKKIFMISITVKPAFPQDCNKPSSSTPIDTLGETSLALWVFPKGPVSSGLLACNLLDLGLMINCQQMVPLLRP